jgi:hypothetical protein
VDELYLVEDCGGMQRRPTLVDEAGNDIIQGQALNNNNKVITNYHNQVK